MTEEIRNHEIILLSRKRHINYGHQSYENEEFGVCVSTFPTIADNAKAHVELQELLNSIELDARRNHKNIQQVWAKEELELARQEALKEDQKRREIKAQVYDFLRENPEATPDIVEETLELTSRSVYSFIDELEEEGKIKRRTCRRLFDIVTSKTEIETEE